MDINRASLKKLQRYAESMKSRAQGALAKADDLVEGVVRTAEVGAAAFTMGLVQGRYTDSKKKEGVTLFSVPLELASGLGLHVLGFMKVAGAQSNHLHNFADGALASYATLAGRGAGLRWRDKALRGKVSGEGASLTDEELAALAASK